MGFIPNDQYIVLNEVIDLSRMERIHGGNPVYLLSPDPDYHDEALKKLRETPHLKVFEKSELPHHYHYGTHPRIEEIIAEADSGWGLTLKKEIMVIPPEPMDMTPKTRICTGYFMQWVRLLSRDTFMKHLKMFVCIH